MTQSIGNYLIQRLLDNGVNHVFGVPGDYVLTFFKQMEESPIQVVNTSDEQGAGFAADAYARVNGLGAACVTYCVGGLKIANAAAQAFAERSPVVIISGAPGTHEQRRAPLLHHTVRGFDTQLRVFEQLTVAQAVLDDPATAAFEIERVLAAVRRHSRPVYIEIPRDMAGTEIGPLTRHLLAEPEGDPEALAVAVAEAVEHLTRAERPVILAGEELHRFGLQAELATIVHKTGIPVAATITGKSVFPESDGAYLGIYEGAMGRDAVRDYVEKSDCLMLLGAQLTDMNLGVYTARIDRRYAIYAASDRIAIGHHSFDGVSMADFVARLAAHPWLPRDVPPFEHPEHPGLFNPGNRPMTVEALFRQVNAFLEDDMVVIADTGDALFGAEDLHIANSVHFLAPAYYCSLGFAVPAALGVKAAKPHLRPLVLVGDGAFQMTGMEVATIARYGGNPIIVVLDNGGYGTERPMLDGTYNDVPVWHYWKIPEILGAGLGLRVTTETEMDEALKQARANSNGVSIIQVMLDRNDHSPALGRLTATLGERARGKA
jgi:TPP-dependent 2-oxoacid decarboxylase